MSSDAPRFDVERAKAAAARIRYTEIKNALEEVHIRAVSPDETFTVDMGVGGSILAVNLTRESMRKAPEELSRALLETINDGMKQVAAVTNQLVAPYLSSADLDLNAITSGRLPRTAEPPPKPDLVREIEAASAVPKKPLGRFARPPAPPVDDTPEGEDVTWRG